MSMAIALAADPDIIGFDEGTLTTLQRTTADEINEQNARNSQSKLTALDYTLDEFQEPIITIEKDNTHFEVLPRIPLAHTQTLYPRQKILPIDEASKRMDHLYQYLYMSSSSSTSTIERNAKLIQFSHSGHLLFSAGHVDGSIFVREIDSRTGFIVSSGDFLGHRHQVVSISSDFISGANTDVIASCDAFGQVLVWTVSLSQTQQSNVRLYIISRRPQRMFRTISSPTSCLDISWQMGIVAVASESSVRLFSIEREELLRCIDLSTLCLAEDLHSPIISSENTSIPTSENQLTMSDKNITHIEQILNESSSTLCYARSKLHSVKYVRIPSHSSSHSQGPLPIQTSSSTNINETTTPNSNDNNTNSSSIQNDSVFTIHRLTLCNDGIIILHIQVCYAQVQSESESHSTTTSSAVTVVNTESNIDLPTTIMDDSTTHEPDNNTDTKTTTHNTNTANNTNTKLSSVHMLLSLSLSGYQTGRVVLSSPITYLNCVGRGDITLAGFEDGKVALYNSHDLKLLYEFYPYEDAQCISATYQTAMNSPLLPSAIICVKVGPHELHPAVICASTSMGELYFKPLPDFIRWEKTRLPSALSQIVNAPLQAVRGTLQQATSFGAWTSEQAGALATNAKSFADETITELSKVSSFQSYDLQIVIVTIAAYCILLLVIDLLFSYFIYIYIYICLQVVFTVVIPCNIKPFTLVALFSVENHIRKQHFLCLSKQMFSSFQFIKN